MAPKINSPRNRKRFTPNEVVSFVGKSNFSRYLIRYTSFMGICGLIAVFNTVYIFIFENPSVNIKYIDSATNKVDFQTAYVKDDIAIFYNAYIPKSNISNALRIIKEQLHLRASSPILSNSTLYYTHIGEQNVIFPPCNKCTLLSAVPEGGEDLTLQALHNYCTVNPSGRAIYIHTKGSFTISEINERLRTLNTRAAFSDECVKMPKYVPGDDSSCNVCSMKAIGFPFPTTVGNMYVGDCEYIRQLIPPSEYTERRTNMMKRLWNMTKEEVLSELEVTKYHPGEDHLKSWNDNEWQFTRKAWIGTERWAMEHWIFSHPTIRPCDVFGAYRISHDRLPKKRWSGATMVRKLSPRQRRKNFKMPLHPYFRLGGLLHSFKQLYQAVPPELSWIYHLEGKSTQKGESLDPFFETLDMPITNNATEILLRYRQLVSQHDPDKNESSEKGATNEEAKARLQTITEAYVALREVVTIP